MPNVALNNVIIQLFVKQFQTFVKRSALWFQDKFIMIFQLLPDTY